MFSEFHDESMPEAARDHVFPCATPAPTSSNDAQHEPFFRKNTDPFEAKIRTSRQPSTRDELLAVLDEVDVIYEAFLDLLSSYQAISSDPSLLPLLSNRDSVRPSDSEIDLPTFEKSILEMTSLLSERQQEFTKLILGAKKEAEVDLAIQGLVVEADKLKDQVQALQSRLKEAEQILSNTLHMTKQKTDSIKAADDAQLSLDEIIRYAHRISVGFSVAVPPNWMPGDPRRPYPTEMEMRAGVLAKETTNIPPPPNQILSLPTKNLVDVTQQFLGSNAGPYTMSPQSLAQGVLDSPKTLLTSGLQREVSADDQDVETMSTDTSSTSSSEEDS